ncbi:MAG: AAA family ATPase, partial [Clostridiales bacterium]|nr:AAA family ATPase [Clostridiales bacterium]
MLNQLRIKNVALIEEADITFREGLNILSGETGAGKSILIGAILFLLGARPDKDFVRNGAQTAYVEGLAAVVNRANREAAAAMGLEPDEEGAIFISRTLSEQGRSVCRVNGHSVSVGMLRDMSALLVDVHGQREHQSLLNPAAHIRLLDQFCDIEADKAELTESLNQYREIIRSIKTIEGNGRDRAGRMELLQYQFDEINEANIRPNEEDALNARKALLSSVGRISKNTRETLTRLSGDDSAAAPLIAASIGLLREAGVSDPRCAEMSDQLAEIQELLSDLIKDLSLYTENLRDDPNALEEVEERLDLLYRLKKKYGGGISDVLAHYERVKSEMERLSN